MLSNETNIYFIMETVRVNKWWFDKMPVDAQEQITKELIILSENKKALSVG